MLLLFSVVVVLISINCITIVIVIIVSGRVWAVFSAPTFLVLVGNHPDVQEYNDDDDDDDNSNNDNNDNE